MNAEPVRILLLSSDDHERRDLSSWLTAHIPGADVISFSGLSEVFSHGLRTTGPPRLVILSAGFTQAWSLDEFAELWNELPLARWVIVQNGWSDSAIRHWPWLPPSCCVPRERLELRLRQEVETLKNLADPLPVSASLEETFERDAELPPECDISGLTIGLFTPDRDLRSLWTALVTSYGGRIVSLEQQPNAMLWDCDPWQKDRIEQLETYRRRDPSCRIIGLRNIVHDLVASAAQDAGVDVLFPKQLSAALVLEALASSPVEINEPA